MTAESSFASANQYVKQYSRRFTITKLIEIFKRPLFIALALALALCAANNLLGIGPDYLQYKHIWFYLDKNNPFQDSRIELGFLLLAWLGKYILNIGVDVFIGILAFVSLVIKFRILANKNNALILAILYVFSLYLLHEMIQVRVSIALAFGYLAIEQLEKAKRANYLFLFLISISLHYSALLLAIAYVYVFITRFVKHTLTVVFFISGTVVYAAIMLVDAMVIINPLVEIYADNRDQFNVSFLNARTILLGGMLALALTNWRDLRGKADVYVLIGLACYALFFTMHEIPVLAHRILEISFFSYFLWIGGLKNKYVRILATSMLAILCFYEGYRMLCIDQLFV